MRRVVALYVSPQGPYRRLEAVDPWYEERDALRYEGPYPVVAHPPCGPWGRMRFLCRYHNAACAPRAVEQVRAFGGVLEHPAQSSLWRACKLPYPGELPDGYGGSTYEVRQVSWGHTCEKPTWLYVVGVAPDDVLAGVRTGGVATRRVTSGPRGPQLPSASRKAYTLTPPAFAGWLVQLARLSRVREVNASRAATASA